MEKVQRHRRYFLEPLKALIRFCDKYGIDDIEEMEQADEKQILSVFKQGVGNYKKTGF